MFHFISDLEQFKTCMCGNRMWNVSSPTENFTYYNYDDNNNNNNNNNNISSLENNNSSVDYNGWEPVPEVCSDMSSNFTEVVPPNLPFRVVEQILNTRVSVALCAFGLVGNVCNMFVLVPQGRHCSMGRIEKFVYWGLISLAISDFFFCMSVIPNSNVERDPITNDPFYFFLYYSAYGHAFTNLFTMISTYLTVAMALGRYLAICHPFRAREIIGTTAAKWSVFIIYGFCIVFSIPRFMNYRVVSIKCDHQEETWYFRWPNMFHFKISPSLDLIYKWIYFVVGILAPFVCLSFSNYYLVTALRKASTKLRLLRAIEVSPVDQYRPITLTLVVLVFTYILLVSPVEIIHFLRQLFLKEGSSDDLYNLLAAILNALQAVNFSVNFILYYVINVHFRRSVIKLLRCQYLLTEYEARMTTGSMMTGSAGSVTLSTYLTASKTNASINQGEVKA